MSVMLADGLSLVNRISVARPYVFGEPVCRKSEGSAEADREGEVRGPAVEPVLPDPEPLRGFLCREESIGLRQGWSGRMRRPQPLPLR
jgi:hypothetical protein